MDENLMWEIRAFVYRHFAETTHPPQVDETTARFALTHEEADSAYEELHGRSIEQAQIIFKELDLTSEFWPAI